jgi:osmotically-inducible protein OsmY
MVVVVLALVCPAFTAAMAQTALTGSRAASEAAAASDEGPQLVTTDQLITLQVQDQLQKDPRFRRADVTVETSGGVVKLMGSMPSAYALSAVNDVVRKTPGVVGVDSYLRLLGNAPQAPAPP